MGLCRRVDRQGGCPSERWCETGSEWIGPKRHRGTAMGHHAGTGVSPEQSRSGVMDATGKISRKAKVPTRPELLTRSLREFGGVDAEISGLGRSGSGVGRSRHWRASTETSGAAMLSQEPCLGVSWNARRSRSRKAAVRAHAAIESKTARPPF